MVGRKHETMQVYRQPTPAELERLTDVLTTLTVTDPRNQPATRRVPASRPRLRTLIVLLLPIVALLIAVIAQVAGK